MTLAQILAIILAFVAITDVALCYLWLLPKIRKNSAPDIVMFLAPKEQERAMKQEIAIKKVKALVDCWAVLALAIAYILWTNPNML